MDRSEALGRLADAPVARLATIRPEGRPHVVPVTFAVLGDRIVTAIDHKPKTTTRLQRLANIEANPEVSLLADHYTDDWSGLWWVRVDGRAEIHDSHPEAVSALVAKYPPYRDRSPHGPMIVISIDHVAGWRVGS